MAKPKATKAAKKKTTKPVKPKYQKLCFQAFITAGTVLLAVTKTNEVYYWNFIDAKWVPNWDTDGSLKKKAEDMKAEQVAQRLQLDQQEKTKAEANTTHVALKRVGGVDALT